MLQQQECALSDRVRISLSPSQVKDSVLDVMAGVKIDRLNLVTKVGVIVAYSTKRVNQSISQDSQVCSNTKYLK